MNEPKSRVLKMIRKQKAENEAENTMLGSDSILMFTQHLR